MELILVALYRRYVSMLAIEDTIIDILTEDIWCQLKSI